MAIDGKFNVTMDTPMGPQNGVVTFTTEGVVLRGTAQIAGANANFTGTVEGEKAKWDSVIPSPMGGNITLNFDVIVTGTDLSGTVVLGPFGTSSIKGKKV